MVRPQSGSPRLKHRPSAEGYNSIHHEDHYGPHSRSQRGFRGPPGKGPPSWREPSGRGHFTKRPPLMGDRREQWRPYNEGPFRGFSIQGQPPRGYRRQSPPRPYCPPPAQPRSSPHGPPVQRGAPFHGHHSGHWPPSPRHYHGPHPERRPPPAGPPHSPHRGQQRRPSPAHDQERSWGPGRQHGPRERIFDRPLREGGHWNGPGPFPHPPNQERRLSSSPQRKSREFYNRGSYPERWSAERDPRRQHGVVRREREASGRYGAEWPRGHPPYRAPTWKEGPSSSFFQNHAPHQRLNGLARKRKLPEEGGPPPHTGPGAVHPGPPKRPHREPSLHPPGPRGFGGRTLSFMDKSRLLKGRKMRAESMARLKTLQPRHKEPKKTPSPKPRKERERGSSVEATGSSDSQDEDEEEEPKPVIKSGVRKPTPKRLSPKSDSSSSKSPRESETITVQVDTRPPLSPHSSPPTEPTLPPDLVVVSQWHAGPRPSTRNSAPWRNRAPKPKSEISFNPNEHVTLNERFSKLKDSASASEQDQSLHFSDLKIHRKVDMLLLNPKPGKPFDKPETSQKSSFHPTIPRVKKTAPEPAGFIRKPLVASLVPRPSLHQKPVFRKSQSIMSKYRNMQTLRQRVPYPRGHSYRRW